MIVPTTVMFHLGKVSVGCPAGESQVDPSKTTGVGTVEDTGPPLRFVRALEGPWVGSRHTCRQ